jgi:prepilin-type N-terminal cleavage/methylation domain-containing protein
MKNERGLTLIEVLATITISSIVLAVGFMLFSSVNGLFNNTVQKSTDNTSINAVIDTISRELADPVALYYINSATGSELRFKTFDNRYMALVYVKSTKSLTLVKSDSPSTTQDITAFTFQTPKVLATNIVADETNTGLAFEINKNATGTDLDTNIIITATTLKTIYLSIAFQKTTVTPSGGKILTYSPPYNVNVSMSYP